ncbi:glycoside hydrolase family 28 protein [Actinophytocola oryzae]|uniref:Pectate lyase-like protein n=1 Tax=Actinophytocola oryzae TaxID=502181 RepID=A0A4R7W0F3_9PSEU|nr:glycoside hydrolase family 28 protein [Actinophytocola oryzae]TDV55007.1 pectate lyase-like protein [Actinophytocola oryzae]
MSSRWSRRSFVGRAAAATTGTFLGAAIFGRDAAGADPWDRADAIARSVRPPRFPRREFLVTRFGARGDGVTDCTRAFAEAVRACARAGGGRVVVPDGRYLTGPIHLRSNVDLHVTEGATIAFSQDPNAYLPAVYTRWEGTELYNYSPLVYAYDQRNIAVTGTGTLDGQADNAHWWPWKGSTAYGWRPGDPEQSAARTRLQTMAEQGVPVAQRVFGAGDCLRPNFVQPYRCRDVLVEGVTIVNSPMWEIHPVLSRNVLVRDVKVATHGPNNDGCNPESSRDVVIRGCTFDTGDDCIAIKSGRNADGRRVNVPSERILVEDCDFAAGHGGVTVGSEMSGGVRDVYARNLRLSSPDLDTALRFKTNSVRGGFIHDFHARDLTVGTVAQAAITIDFYYEEGPGHGFDPDVTGITVDSMTVEHAQRALNLRGYPEDPVGEVRLSNVDFRQTAAPSVVENVTGLVLDDVYENGAPMSV